MSKLLGKCIAFFIIAWDYAKYYSAREYYSRKRKIEIQRDRAFKDAHGLV